MDPSAVSFQVRPVEVANGRTGPHDIAEDLQPSFGSLEQHHVVSLSPSRRCLPNRLSAEPNSPVYGGSCAQSCIFFIRRLQARPTAYIQELGCHLIVVRLSQAAQQAERNAALGIRGQDLPRPAFGSSPNLQAILSPCQSVSGFTAAYSTAVLVVRNRRLHESATSTLNSNRQHYGNACSKQADAASVTNLQLSGGALPASCFGADERAMCARLHSLCSSAGWAALPGR